MQYVKPLLDIDPSFQYLDQNDKSRLFLFIL